MQFQSHDESSGLSENLGTFGLLIISILFLKKKVVIFLPLFDYVDCFENTCRELKMDKFSHCDHRVWPPWQPDRQSTVNVKQLLL